MEVVFLSLGPRERPLGRRDPDIGALEICESVGDLGEVARALDRNRSNVPMHSVFPPGSTGYSSQGYAEFNSPSSLLRVDRCSIANRRSGNVRDQDL